MAPVALTLASTDPVELWAWMRSAVWLATAWTTRPLLPVAPVPMASCEVESAVVSELTESLLAALATPTPTRPLVVSTPKTDVALACWIWKAEVESVAFLKRAEPLAVRLLLADTVVLLPRLIAVALVEPIDKDEEDKAS